MKKDVRREPYLLSFKNVKDRISNHHYAVLRNDLLDKVGEKLRGESLVRTDVQVMTRHLLGNTKVAPMVAKYLKH